MLLPGFQDAHVHPVSAASTCCSAICTTPARSPEYERHHPRRTRTAHPDAPWILGGGWSMDVFPGGTPTKESLDRIVPDRPAFLPNRDGHSAWVNTRALELGRDHARHARSGRRPHRAGRRRRPSGTLHEGAMSLVGDLAPADHAGRDVRGAAARARRTSTRSGITAWQDAIVAADDAGEQLRRVPARRAPTGDLTARVIGALWWDRNRGLEQIDDLVALRERGDGRAGSRRPA